MPDRHVLCENQKKCHNVTFAETAFALGTFWIPDSILFYREPGDLRKAVSLSAVTYVM